MVVCDKVLAEKREVILGFDSLSHGGQRNERRLRADNIVQGGVLGALDMGEVRKELFVPGIPVGWVELPRLDGGLCVGLFCLMLGHVVDGIVEGLSVKCIRI